MKINVSVGGSIDDENAIHFTYQTLFGLGCERHIALYFPSTNTLEVHPGNAKKLDKILNALREYRIKDMKRFKGNLDSGNEPVSVMFWC